MVKLKSIKACPYLLETWMFCTVFRFMLQALLLLIDTSNLYICMLPLILEPLFAAYHLYCELFIFSSLPKSPHFFSGSQKLLDMISLISI